MAGKPNPIDFAALARESLQKFAKASAAGYAPVSHGSPVASIASAATTNSSAAASSTQPAATSSSNASAASTPPARGPVRTSAARTPPADATTIAASPSDSKVDTSPKSTETESKNSKPTETKTTPSTQGASTPTSASKQSGKQSSNSQPRPLKPPPQYGNDWKQVLGPQFVALNASFDKTTPVEYENASGSKDWKLFQDKVDDCLEFIGKECSNKRVFVVCSGSLGRMLLPTIDNMSHVHASYVHCADVGGHKQWADQCSKVRVVCDFDADSLLPQLAYDCAYFYYKWAGGLIEKGDKGNAKENLEKASNILKSCTKGLHDKGLETKIADKLKECS